MATDPLSPLDEQDPFRDPTYSIKHYDGLYNEWLCARRHLRGVRAEVEIVADMIEHADQAHEHYRAISDRYRAALWRRRAFLHRAGRHGEVFDGRDALRWQAQYDARASRRPKAGISPQGVSQMPPPRLPTVRRSA